MGVKGLKVDFMDHSDQWMVNFYERVAKACADYRCRRQTVSPSDSLTLNIVRNGGWCGLISR